MNSYSIYSGQDLFLYSNLMIDFQLFPIPKLYEAQPTNLLSPNHHMTLLLEINHHQNPLELFDDIQIPILI